MPLSQLVTGFGALAFVGVGLSMARFDEFCAAFWLFVMAGLVAILGGAWGEVCSVDSFFVRAINTVIAALAAFVICPILIVWLQRKESAWLSKQPPGG
jgi:hypothetical protein